MDYQRIYADPKREWKKVGDQTGCGSIEECSSCDKESDVPSEGGKCEHCDEILIPCHACIIWEEQRFDDCNHTKNGCRYFKQKYMAVETIGVIEEVI